jgi:hypothetical protein
LMATLLHILKRERVRPDYLSNRSTVDFSHRRTLVYLAAVVSARLEAHATVPRTMDTRLPSDLLAD